LDRAEVEKHTPGWEPTTLLAQGVPAQSWGTPETYTGPSAEPRAALTLFTESALEPIARNLKAQWARSLGIHTDIQVWKGEKHGLVLRQWEEDAFAPSMPPFAAAESNVVPLVQQTKRVLRKQHLTPLFPHPLSGWDISGVHLN